MTRLFTPAEAAAINVVGIKTVHNAIDKQVIKVAKARPASRRRLSTAQLVRLKLWEGIGSALDAEKRRRLFDLIEQRPDLPTVHADDFLIVDVGKARDVVNAGISTLLEAEAAIHSPPSILGGAPVFRGTRIPVRAIAEMVDSGASRDEILDGYPALTRRLLELAVIWSRANPARGRPRKLEDRGLKSIAPPKRVRSSKGLASPSGQG